MLLFKVIFVTKSEEFLKFVCLKIHLLIYNRESNCFKLITV